MKNGSNIFLLFFLVLFFSCTSTYSENQPEDTPPSPTSNNNTLSEEDESSSDSQSTQSAILDFKQPKVMRGSIGEHPIKMVLNQNMIADETAGYYSYDKVGKPINLSVEIDGANIKMREILKEKTTGYFEGTLSNNGISGDWLSADKTKTLPFQLKVQEENSPWAGDWFRNNYHASGTLNIFDVTEKEFTFS